MIIIKTSRHGEPPVSHRFEGDRIRIGREEDNDLVLASAACSRYHAEITFDGGVPKITDLGSTNGIVLQDRRVPDYLLSDGLELTLGDHVLEFSIPAEQGAKTVAIPIGGVSAPAAPQSKVLYLHIRNRDRVHGVKIVAGADYVLGRSPGSDVVLEDTGCSGRHAVVFWRDGRPWIRDLDSANGTIVNGDTVTEAAIGLGDRIALGRTEVTVSDRPPDTADEDILLKRTQLGMPAPAAPEARGRENAAPHGSDAAPIPRWVMALAAAAILVTIAGFIAWKMLDRVAPRGDREAGVGASADEMVVQIAHVVRKELSFTVTAAGTVKPQRQVTVSAEVPGRVVAAPAQRGSMVKAGDELVRLDDREIRLQISEASSSITGEQVELAREDYERKQRLFADGAVTRSVLDQSKTHYLGLDSTYRSTQARISQLKERAAKTRIQAPMTGMVAQLEVEPGEFVSPGMPVAVIEDMAEVLVAVEVADRDVVRLRPLQVVEASTDAFPGRIFSGVVERVDSAANPVTRAFEVEARIANPDGELRSGMIISLRILLEKRSALVIPTEALLDVSGETARVLAVSDGVIRSTDVSVGRRSDREVELLSGLAEGAEVVVAGQDRLRDGQRVKTYQAD
jgi:membrane fusion protein (multidrug efflux system)